MKRIILAVLSHRAVMQSPMVFTATQFTGVMDQPIVRMGTKHTEKMALLTALRATQPTAPQETLIALTEIRPTGVMDLRAALMGTPHMGMEEELVPATEASCTATSIFMIEVKEKVRTC